MTLLWHRLALTTALGISLAGCMATTQAPAKPLALTLPAYQQQRLRDAQASGGKDQSDQRLAALAPQTSKSASDAQGLVLLRRTEPVEKPEDVEARIQRLTDAAIAAKAGQLDQRLSAAEQTVTQTNGLTLEQMQKLREDTAHQLDLLKQEADYKAQLAELKASRTAIEQARLEAARAEANSKDFIIAEMGGRETAATARLGAMSAKLEALAMVNNVKLDALKETTDVKLDAQNQRLEDLAQLTTTNQRLMAAETQRMAKVLTQYSDAQISNLAAQTDDTIRRVAEVGQMSVATLRSQTAERLAAMQSDAAEQAGAIAKATELKIATRVAAAQEENETKRLKPQQVKDIAQNTVQESAPQFRALALQTLSDSQDYIRTVARTAVKDDPATRDALKEAARDVITKDNQIVFAIRKVVDQRLKTLPLAMATAPASTTPGAGAPDIYTGDKVSIDSHGLGIAPIGNDPGIEPAAGPDGERIASAQPPSMMRATSRHDWVDLRKFRVVIHEDSKPIEQLVGDVVTKAEPYVGPWEIKWKISAANRDLMQERFSLDAETTFEEFVNYLANYMVNDRGIKLSFSLFDSERVLVISD